MAQEAQVQVTMQINKDNLHFTAPASSYTADVINKRGPVPGSINVAIGGQAIDLSQLVQPGLAWIMNTDSVNYVEWGVYLPDIDLFIPVGELKPGEIHHFRFSRNFGEAYEGTGTGTLSATRQLWFRANTDVVTVQIMVFDT
jgi:hypothetical protein